MVNFNLKKITLFKGIQPFYQLTIDGLGVLDEYIQDLEHTYRKDLIQILNAMERVANHQPVPGSKYHELNRRPKNDPFKDFEFKHGDLRLYGFKSETGKIILLGGYKNAQVKDIRRMRSLKWQYIESLKGNK
jgi:hypothetical protein